jgi:hypothetical protein
LDIRQILTYFQIESNKFDANISKNLNELLFSSGIQVFQNFN